MSIADNFVTSITTYLLDKSTPIAYKTILAAAVVGLILIIDFGLRLSYDLHVNNKLSQLERIQYLKKSYDSNSYELGEILKIEADVLSKKHYSELFQFRSEVYTTPESAEVVDKSSLFGMILSSSYGLLFIWLRLFFFPFSPAARMEPNWMLPLIFLQVVVLIMVGVTTMIAYQIPVIGGNYIYNYILNGVIHGAWIWLVYYLNRR